MPQNHLLYVNGQWRSASDGGTLPLFNPATEQEIGRVARATPADVDAALVAASESFRDWHRSSPLTRAAILERTARILKVRLQEAAHALTTEQGKTLKESRGEYGRAIDVIEWTAKRTADLCAPKLYPTAEFERFLLPEPIGVVAAFSPWNYPALLSARKLAAALGAGCCVILKGPEEAPSAAVALVDALKEAGLPPGVVNLLFGHPPSISSQLLASSIVRMLTFTGSTAVGRQLAEIAGRDLKRCVFELGGHAPVLLFGDADVTLAAQAIADYKFECAGQSCNAPSRVFVEDSVYDQFIDSITEIAGKIRTGDGLDETIDMGPMANPRRITAMQRFMANVIETGGRVLLGGTPLARPGYFWPPTVVTNLPDDALLMREEPFGPLLPISRFSTFEEAIQRANDNQYGLASYVFTSSKDIAAAAINELETGTVHVNQLKGVPADVPVGGVKYSGYGYEGGEDGFKSFLNLKLVGRRLP